MLDSAKPLEAIEGTIPCVITNGKSGRADN